MSTGELRRAIQSLNDGASQEQVNFLTSVISGLQQQVAALSLDDNEQREEIDELQREILVLEAQLNNGGIPVDDMDTITTGLNITVLQAGGSFNSALPEVNFTDNTIPVIADWRYDLWFKPSENSPYSDGTASVLGDNNPLIVNNPGYPIDGRTMPHRIYRFRESEGIQLNSNGEPDTEDYVEFTASAWSQLESLNEEVTLIENNNNSFTSRLALTQNAPAQLHYKVQGESAYTIRLPYEMSFDYDTHQQVTPNEENKVLSTGDIIEMFWKFGPSLEYETQVSTFILGEAANDGIHECFGFNLHNRIALYIPHNPSRTPDEVFYSISALQNKINSATNHSINGRSAVYQLAPGVYPTTGTALGLRNKRNITLWSDPRDRAVLDGQKRGNFGIWIYEEDGGTTANVEVLGFEIENYKHHGIFGGGDSLTRGAGTNVLLAANDIHHCCDDDGAGIVCRVNRSASGYKIWDNVIHDLGADSPLSDENNKGEAIYLGSGGHNDWWIRDISVLGNDIYNLVAEAIEVKRDCRDVVIAYNKIKNINVTSQGAIVASFDNLRDVEDYDANIKIFGNVISGVTSRNHDGSAIVAGVGNIEIYENIIFDIPDYHAIDVYNDANRGFNNARIYDNIIDNAPGRLPIRENVASANNGPINPFVVTRNRNLVRSDAIGDECLFADQPFISGPNPIDINGYRPFPNNVDEVDVPSDNPSNLADLPVTQLAFDLSTLVPRGSFTVDRFNEITNNSHLFSSNLDQLAVVEDSGNNWLEFTHPKNTISENIDFGGLLANRNEYCVSQIVKFREGFDFGGSNLDIQSGKFAYGLAGGASSETGGIVAGGHVNENGWSCRWIWRGDSFKLYTYNWNRSTRLAGNNPAFGEELPPPTTPRTKSHIPIVPGQDYELKMRVKLNSSADTTDGEVEAWVNGELLTYETGIQWMRGTPEIDRAFSGSFHGGGIEWAPSVDSDILIRDVKYTSN